MSKKLLMNIALLAFGAAAMMYIVGTNDRKLSELADMFWLPIPLGILALGAAFRKKEEQQS
ncbi:MAG: hypothetical protein GY810_19070 [Aureispira sp.]|nr:hypothetical protein [Aureispira sp.]